MEASEQKADPRWRSVEKTMRQHGYHANGLIETLHAVQEAYGCLDEEALRRIAAELRVALSHVYGVATFYNYFTMAPPGRHTCVVCMGTACYIKGAGEIMERISKEFNVAPEETSDDGNLSLLSARCIGCCGQAPALVVDGEIWGGLSADEVIERLRRVLNDA
ncbi:NAD(P)H-dependent oxidoreductase subunit E [Candidatus Sumerlaeota bacterium]|nr:NAD(P)H-dependent oxidoreductase subunit E [Candidatus Sumerlaeota bacterium]